MPLNLPYFRNVVKKRFDKESRVLFRNSSWVFVSNATGTFLAFLRSVVIARGLGAETLGHYTVAIAFILTIQELLRLNVGIAIIRYGAQFRTEGRPDKIVSLIKGGILASAASALTSVIVIGIILLLAYDRFITIPHLEQFILLYAVVNGVSFMDNISKAVLNLYYRFRINSVVQMVMDTLEFLVIAGCIYYFRDNLAYFFGSVIIARLANSLICNFAAAAELRKELGPYISSGLSLIKDQYREILRYVTGHSMSNTLKTFMNQGDVLVLSALAGPAAVGLYAVAKKLAYSVLTLTDPLAKSIFPQLSLLVSEKKIFELRVMLRKMTLLTLMPASFFLICAFIFRDEIIRLFYGLQYLQAANTFMIHLLGALQSSVFFWTLPLINSLGLTGLRFRIYLIAIGAGLLVSWIFASAYGAAGVASGLLTANLLITVMFIYYADRQLKAERIINSNVKSNSLSGKSSEISL